MCHNSIQTTLNLGSLFCQKILTWEKNYSPLAPALGACINATVALLTQAIFANGVVKLGNSKSSFLARGMFSLKYEK